MDCRMVKLAVEWSFWVHLPGRRRMSRTWPKIAETRENRRQELKGRSSGSYGPYTLSGLKVVRFVAVDREVEAVRIERGWERKTSS